MPDSKDYLQWSYIVLIIALTIQSILSMSFWVGVDQLHLIDLGAKLSEDGTLLGYSKLKSGGGANLGSLMQILVAIPLYLFNHFQAPMLVPILFTFISFWLLKPVIIRLWNEKGFFVFSIFFFLAPTFLYNAGFLWEPAYLFLPASLHFISAYYLSTDKSKSFWWTLWHLLSLVAVIQIHNSALILIIASIILIYRKQIRLSAQGTIVAFVIGLMFFLPLINELVFNNGGLEISSAEGYIGKSAVKVMPALKGFFYIFKLTGYDMVRGLKETPFLSLTATRITLQALSVVTVIIGIYVNWKYIKYLRKNRSNEEEMGKEKAWGFAEAYWLSIVSGTVVSALLSPITLQEWMLVIALIAFKIPLLHFFVNTKGFGKFNFAVIALFLIVGISSLVFIYYGQDKFNRNGREPDYFNDESKERIEHYFDLKEDV